jgi:hypothetical protein
VYCPAGMVDQAAEILVPPRPYRHLERIEGEIGTQVIRDLPAQDATSEQIHHESGIDPAGKCLHVGMPATQRRFGAAASKHRSSRSDGRSAGSPGSVAGGLFRPGLAPRIPSSRISRSTVHRACTDSELATGTVTCSLAV